MMIAGLLIIIVTALSAILNSSSTLYTRLQSHEIDLATGHSTIPYAGNMKERISFWLGLPDRKTEGKDFRITVSILDTEQKLITGYRRDFKYKTTRNDLAGSHYYKIASHKFGVEFRGFLRYELEGEWMPQAPASLVLRKSRETTFTNREILMVILGGLVLATGFGFIVSNTNE